MAEKSCEESCEKSSIFDRKLLSKKLLVHAHYGAKEVLCTGGLVERGGVLVQNSSLTPPPACATKKDHAAPFLIGCCANNAKTANKPHAFDHDTRAPSASHQSAWHSIWRYPARRLHCQSISRKTSWTHWRSSQTRTEVRRSTRQPTHTEINHTDKPSSYASSK